MERIRSRGNVHRKFTGFEVEGALPAVGAKIQADGRDIGEITSVASLPLAGGERSVALGYMRRETSRFRASNFRQATRGFQSRLCRSPKYSNAKTCKH